jgi:hypothetical protein
MYAPGIGANQNSPHSQRCTVYLLYVQLCMFAVCFETMYVI